MLGDATLGVGHCRSARRPDVNARRPGVYELLGVRGVLTSGTSYCAPAPAERRTLSSRLNTPSHGWLDTMSDGLPPDAHIMGKSAMRPVRIGPKQRSIGAEKT
jgi:hypothetical protein